jgi:hypothetical protein
MLSVVMAGLVASFQKSGALKEVPKELQGISAENIKFMHEHAAELEQMQKELAALSKGMSQTAVSCGQRLVADHVACVEPQLGNSQNLTWPSTLSSRNRPLMVVIGPSMRPFE